MPKLTLTSLFMYPVKSLGGIELEEAIITPTGLLGDRRWLIIDDNNSGVTQRKISQLAKIKTALSGNYPTSPEDITLKLSHPEFEHIVFNSEMFLSQEKTMVKVWNDECEAHIAPSHINDWITEASQSNSQLRLVYFAPNFMRAKKEERFGDHHTHFADAAPYLVATEDSLNRLNDELTQKNLPSSEMRQFRPNLVFKGLPAFSEHEQHEIKSVDGDIHFNLHDHCQRCSMITINQQTGDKLGKQAPFTTLAELNPMPDNDKAPVFGVNTTLQTGKDKLVRAGSSWIIN